MFVRAKQLKIRNRDFATLRTVSSRVARPRVRTTYNIDPNDVSALNPIDNTIAITCVHPFVDLNPRDFSFRIFSRDRVSIDRFRNYTVNRLLIFKRINYCLPLSFIELTL